MDEFVGFVIIALVAVFFAGGFEDCSCGVSCSSRRNNWTKACAKERSLRECQMDAYELYHCPPTRRK